MPDDRRASCVRCGGHKRNVGPISWSGLCQQCAVERVAENIEGMATMAEPQNRKWRRGLAKRIGAVLLDDLPPRT